MRIERLRELSNYNATLTPRERYRKGKLEKPFKVQ